MLTNRPISPQYAFERYRAYAGDIAYVILVGGQVVTPLEGTYSLVFHARATRKKVVLTPLVSDNRLVFELDDTARAQLTDDFYNVELIRTLNGQPYLIHQATFAWKVEPSRGTDSVPVPPDLAINILDLSEYEFLGNVYIPGGTQLTVQNVQDIVIDLIGDPNRDFNSDFLVALNT